PLLDDEAVARLQLRLHRRRRGSRLRDEFLVALVHYGARLGCRPRVGGQLPLAGLGSVGGFCAPCGPLRRGVSAHAPSPSSSAVHTSMISSASSIWSMSVNLLYGKRTRACAASQLAYVFAIMVG